MRGTARVLSTARTVIFRMILKYAWLIVSPFQEFATAATFAFSLNFELIVTGTDLHDESAFLRLTFGRISAFGNVRARATR